MEGPLNTIFFQKRLRKPRTYGFITETPLNLIQEKKMSQDKNNPSINYQKNMKSTARFSKRFYTTSTNQSEKTIDQDTLPSNKSSDDEKPDKEPIIPTQEARNYDVTKHLNPTFLTKTNDLLLKFQRNDSNYEKTLCKSRPITEITKVRCKRTCVNPRKLLSSIDDVSANIFESQSIETDRAQSKKPEFDEKNIKEADSKLEENGCSFRNLTIQTEDKEIPKLTLKLRSGSNFFEKDKITSPFGRNSPFSALIGSPMLISNTFEEFKDLNKLELRRKIFRKYSITKRERSPILQQMNEVKLETDEEKVEVDFETYVSRRKEFELFYEDELFKTGYFDYSNNNEENEEFGRRKKEKKSGLIQRDVAGGGFISVIKLKNNFKKEIVHGTQKLYNKYCSLEKDPVEMEKDASKNKKSESFLRGLLS